MYTAFFQLTQAPFSIAPDPQYLYMSERHREALAHLLYGVNSGGGFVLLTGEIGAGKTTVCRCFLEQIPENCKVAYIFNPKMSVEELLHAICDEFGLALPPAQTSKEYVDALNRFLLETHAKGQNNVLIIDEAQNLAPQVLEQLRLLTNLETNQRKLLQIILIGQPELRGMLAQPELEQLAQRVIARYHLGPLSVSEIGRYISHRMRVAGMTTPIPFPARLMPLIRKLTGGIPRRINLLCDRALLGAYAGSRSRVDRKIIVQAGREVFGSAGSSRSWWLVGLFTLLTVVLGGVGWYWYQMGVSATATKALPQPRVLASTAASAAASAASKVAASAAVAAPTLVEPSGTSSSASMVDLAQLWGKTLSGPDPCQLAPKHNLRCFSSNGGWDELRELGRPALLVLHDARRGHYRGILLALNEQQARLRIDGQEQVFALSELKSRFNGEFTTLWTVPRRFRDEVIDGDRGVDVDWIGTQIARFDRLGKPRDNAIFDQAMSQRVRQFQLEQKLKPDGLVGPKTYMRLNRLAGIVEPELSASMAAAVKVKK
jgi:general secretion pathway protein A